MVKLEKLIQAEDGRLFSSDKRRISLDCAMPQGKIMALVVANPCVDVSNEINKLVERNSVLIPKYANAYVASDFSGDTQHLRKSDLEGNEKLYCVFAIQFYCIV